MISRIGHLHIRVRAPSGSDAVAARDAFEAAVRDAVLALERELRDEVLFVRELEIPLRAVRRGVGRVEWRARLDEILRRELRAVRTRLRAKAGTTEAIVEDGAAWFVSEGAYFAEALLRERVTPNDWVFGALAPPNMVEVLERVPPLVLADVVAMVAARSAPKGPALSHQELLAWTDAVVLRLSSVDPERLLGALLPSNGARPVARSDRTPSLGPGEEQLPIAARRALELLRSSTAPMRRLAALGVLFATWPAARALATRAASTDQAASREQPISLLATEALVLLVAAEHARESLSAIGAEYDERGSRAARWAIARALAQPRVSPYDPLVLLFAGEERASGPTDMIFHDLDAEPLHSLAVRAAASLHDGVLRFWRSGDRVYVLAGEICLDYVEASEMDLLADVVRRFTMRSGAPPAQVTPLDEPPMHDVDLVLAADLPILPEPWRAAVLTFVSAIRAQLHASRMDPDELAGTSAALRVVTSNRFELVASAFTRALLARRVAFPVRLGRASIELE